jgi:hypothetical protein
MLTVTKLGLPPELRRSLACTNIIENVMGTVRRVSRNVKYWRSPSMALRWAGAAMQEAAKGFRRLKAYKQLPILQAALAVRTARASSSNAHLAQTTKAVSASDARFVLFNIKWDIAQIHKPPAMRFCCPGANRSLTFVLIRCTLFLDDAARRYQRPPLGKWRGPSL